MSRWFTGVLAVVVFAAVVSMHLVAIHKLDTLNAQLAQMVRDLKEPSDAR